MSAFQWILRDASNGNFFQLTKDPVGWKELSTKLYRSERYHGAFLEPSLKQFTFLNNGGGMEFILDVFEQKDVNGTIELTILEQFNSSSTFQKLLAACLNLSTINALDDRVTVNIEHSSLYQKVTTREETLVDLEKTESIGDATITAPPTKTILLHSKKIYLESQMAYNTLPHTDSGTFNIDPFQYPLYRGFFGHPFTTNKSELGNFTGSAHYTNFGLPNNIGSIADQIGLFEIYSADNELLKFPTLISYDYNFKGVFSEVESGSDTRQLAPLSLVLLHGPSIDNAIGITLFTHSDAAHGNIDVPFDVSGTGTLPLNEGDRVWLYWYYNTTFTTGGGPVTLDLSWEYEIANFKMYIHSETPSSNCKTQLIHEVWNQVADSIADDDGKFKSTLYGRVDSAKRAYAANGEGSNLAITNGLNIRAINSPIFACLKDLFDTCSALDNIGLGIVGDDYIEVEKLEYFYNPNNRVITLPNVNKITTSVYSQRYYNNIQVGFNLWETEFTGGRLEPNTNHEYSTRVQAIKGDYTKLSPYIGSSFAIELTRRKKGGSSAVYNGGDSTDWRYDDNNFVLATINEINCSVIFFHLPTNNIYVQDLKLEGQLFTGDVIQVSYAGVNAGTYNITDVTNNGSDTIINVAETVTNEGPIAITITRPTNTFTAAERAELFTGVTNYYSPETSYNLRYSPARMLQAHMNAITGCLQRIGGALKFVTGQANIILGGYMNGSGNQHDYSGQHLVENQDFQYNDSNVRNYKPLWRPLLDTFDYPLTPEQFQSIVTNPYGYIEYYKSPDDIRRGFLIEADRKLETGLTSFKILLKP